MKKFFHHAFGIFGLFYMGYGTMLIMSNQGAKYCHDGQPLDTVWPWFALAIILLFGHFITE